jgi:hypothetical protein
MSTGRKIGSKAKKRWNQSMSRLIDGLGRNIIVYLPDRRLECPNCYYDKVHDKSSGIPKVGPSSSTYFTVGRCPVCSGRGVRVVSRKRCIEGMVIWNPQGNATNSLTFSQAGMEGATSVEIKTDICYLDLIKESKYVVVDGIQCKLSNPPIIRGVGGKSVLIATFFTTRKPKLDSGEYV